MSSDRTTSYINLEQQNASVENQNSNVPHLNTESNNEKENPNMQQVTPCETKTSISPKIDEMNNTNAKLKRKKSKQESGNKSNLLCNCKKSHCVKLYCECFSAELYCIKDCGCIDCINQESYEVHVLRQQIKTKNLASALKEGWKDGTTSQLRGCKCNKSMCLKKYCECFQARASCTKACTCGSCHNSFGIREGSNNTDHGSKRDGMTNLQGSSPTLSGAKQQHPHNISSNGNNYSESSSLNFDSTSLYELLYGGNNNNYDSLQIPLLQKQVTSENGMTNCDTLQQHMSFSSSNFASQPCLSMPSNSPPRYNNLPCDQPSTSYIGEGLSSKSMLDLRGSQHDTSQMTVPNFALVVPRVNASSGFTQNGNDHEKSTLFNKEFKEDCKK